VALRPRLSPGVPLSGQRERCQTKLWLRAVNSRGASRWAESQQVLTKSCRSRAETG
jgi:hypothetical protein